MQIVRDLFVLWSEVDDRSRTHVVGTLAERAGGYRFEYAAGLTEAKLRGFPLLFEFPDERASYESRYLFPTFHERIPSPARPDFRRMIESWGVADADDKMEILAKSGGVQLTDRIELAEYRDVSDDLATPLELRVAGARHRVPLVALPLGSDVVLRREPDNDADPNAVRVEDESGALAGYVPRQYAALFARLLASETPLHARVVRQLGEPGTTEMRAVVRVERASPFARYVR